jgi:hypothetical protein
MPVLTYGLTDTVFQRDGVYFQFCPLFHISSGVVKFHVLSHTDVRILLRPRPPRRNSKACTALPLHSAWFILPRLTLGALNEILSLSLFGPVPLLARVLNTVETNKYQL